MVAAAQIAKNSLAEVISKQADTIRRTLAKRGYHSQKCFNQPTWKVFPGPSETDFLVLKYLTPGGWVLQEGTTARKQGELWQIVQEAIAI